MPVPAEEKQPTHLCFFCGAESCYHCPECGCDVREEGHTDRCSLRPRDVLPADRDDAPDDDYDPSQYVPSQVQASPNGSWYDEIGEVPVPTGLKKVRQKKKIVQKLTLPLPIAKTYKEHVARWKDCQLCPLGRQRSNIVLCRGSLPCDVLYLGEAPGVSEDARGIPFDGPAGMLLDAIDASVLESFKGLRRAWTNLVACFPREAKAVKINEPDGEEIEACAERLRELINLAQPRLIVQVGTLSQKWLPRVAPDWVGPTVHIQHPASILRMPSLSQSLAAQRCVIQIVTALRKLPPAP